MARRKDRKRRGGRYGLAGRGEDVNPMNYLSNLSDAMLVLAMGIMVALVLHWNVNLSESSGDVDTDDPDQIVMFNQDDLENQEKLPDTATPTGDVYYDATTDTYYIVRDGEQTPIGGESNP